MPAVTLRLAEVQDAVRNDFFEELEAAGADAGAFASRSVTIHGSRYL